MNLKHKITALLSLKLLFLICCIVFTSCSNRKKQLKLNQIQVIGSHNSYKIAIEKPLWQYLYSKDSVKALALQYTHISIEKQLDLGLRNLEFDVYYDPEGGLYTHPKGLKVVEQFQNKPQEYDKENKLNLPGFKMFHIQDIDFRSHFLLFKEGLIAVKNWSNKHPNHTPIIILMNTNDKAFENLKTPLPFTTEAYSALNKVILSVLKNKLIFPAEVQGKYNSLEKAVLTKGWPSLNETKGKFLFVLDEKEEKIQRYLQAFANKKERIFFVNVKEGHPEAGFRIINNPIKDFKYIKELVKKGYMVRTRADSGTKEARNNDYQKFEKAKASGAQVISTDYYIPTQLFPSKFQIQFKENTYERIQKKHNEK